MSAFDSLSSWMEHFAGDIKTFWLVAIQPASDVNRWNIFKVNKFIMNRSKVVDNKYEASSRLGDRSILVWRIPLTVAISCQFFPSPHNTQPPTGLWPASAARTQVREVWEEEDGRERPSLARPVVLLSLSLMVIWSWLRLSSSSSQSSLSRQSNQVNTADRATLFCSSTLLRGGAVWCISSLISVSPHGL